MYCKFESFCVLGGGAPCEGGFCDEKGRFAKLQSEKCPIMVNHGYADRLCDCDVPFWIRASVPNDVPCASGDDCIPKKYFPELVSQAIAGKIKLNRDETISLARTIKSTIRRASGQQSRVSGIVPRPQAPSPA